jgi:class 3 adenylate cyclase
LLVETFTFLFTDIEGSTALLRRLGEDVYAGVLADHHTLIRSGLAAHDGAEVDTQGDAFFAVFSSPRGCAAAAEMQRAVEAAAWPAVCVVYRTPAQAARLLAEAIACTGRSGDQFVNSMLHDQAGVDALCAGDIPAARAHLEQAAEATCAIGQESGIVMGNLGWARREEGDLDGARSMFEARLRMSRRRGEERGIAYAGLGLACLAADLDDWHRAAMLHGAAQVVLDRTGEPWPEPCARYRRDSLAGVRAHLGDEQADRAYAKGTTLSTDEAFHLALAQPDRPVALLCSAAARSATASSPPLRRSSQAGPFHRKDL